MVGVTRLQCVRNEPIEIKAGSSYIYIAQVKRRREMWREMMIENEGSLINKVMNGQFAGKRPRGRPRKRWRGEFLRIVPLHFAYILKA